MDTQHQLNIEDFLLPVDHWYDAPDEVRKQVLKAMHPDAPAGIASVLVGKDGLYRFWYVVSFPKDGGTKIVWEGKVMRN